MQSFRHHHRVLFRLTIVIWVLAMIVTALHGCLVQSAHNPAAVHEPHATLHQPDDHTLHATGCLKYCSDAATAISPASQTSPAGLTALAFFLLLPGILLLDLTRKITFATIAFRSPPPLFPPARLIFVRFND
ncbi:hypothetical protein ACIPZ8_27185 [Pseudomonas sp. NPDC089422]|uniref:hypothetical protein n=1 Tax=Pseudomonas sp. NPDC089422 TaxID=3364466 RepID=UPI0038099AD5